MWLCVLSKKPKFLDRTRKNINKQCTSHTENEFRILSQPHTLLFWRIVIFTKVYHYHNIVLLYSFAVAFLYIYGKKKNKQWPLPFFFVRKQTKKTPGTFPFSSTQPFDRNTQYTHICQSIVCRLLYWYSKCSLSTLGRPFLKGSSAVNLFLF